MFRSILVAVDSSHAAHNAVRRASLLAARFQARLTLLQVLAPTGLQLPYGLFAATVKADLLVIGAKTRNPFHDSVFGTRTQRLLQWSRHPFLVVKTPATAAYARVLVPTDFTACSEASLRLALKMVPDASVNVFHALSTHREAKMRAAHVPADGILQYVTSSREKCLRRLNAMATRAGCQGAQSSVGRGDPSFLCLERQKAVAADLIVMGKEGQGQSETSSSLMGSVAQHLVAKAGCDVLAIPRLALPRLDDSTSVQRPAAHLNALPVRNEGSWIRRGAAPMCAGGY